MVRVLLEFLFNYLFFSVYILIIEKHHLFILFEKNKYVKPFYILLSYLKKNNLLLLITSNFILI